jgi:PAS domain S-box-containing protein
MDSLSAAPITVARPAVLHVDDSPADRYRRRRILEAAGFRVADVATAAEARTQISIDRPDLVLLDVRLPDTNGFDLAREIKAEATETERDVGVVLISSFFIESEFRVKGLESGADAYLIEPVTDAELVATLRAVTRRVEQLKQARENERLLDAVFEYVPDGITVADAPDVTIRRVSRFGLAMVGRSREELEHIPAADHPTKWAVFRSDGVTPARAEELPLTRAVATGAVIRDEEWVLLRSDGHQVVTLCNAGPIREADGRVTGGIVAWRDITARRHVEDELKRRTQELHQADLTKNDFLATIVHEVRQPIQAALAAIGVMKGRTDQRMGQRARDVVERQLLLIARIVEDLLDATRIMRGDFTLRLEAHDVGDVLRRSLETLRATFEERQLTIGTSFPRAPVSVYGDAARLQQVFVNLLSNAARYTPSGGQVEIALETSAGSAIVRVKDTGEGIPPERLPRLFDLFVRGSEHSAGFGIGLAVVRALVEAHGGTVTAASEGAGKGSEFVVTLPLR